MDNGILIGALTAFSALAGALIAQWGARQTAKLQAELTMQREAAQWVRQDAEKLTARRNEFLGLVLLAQNRMLDMLDRYPESALGASADEPASAARQAYAVALLSLGDMRALAKSFYLATAMLQLSLERDEGDVSVTERAAAWKKSFFEIAQ